MAGAPRGNQNSTRDKRAWTNAIRRAVAQRDGDALRKLADKLFDMALEGDLQAMKEIGDRLEGKPVQATEISGPEGGPVEVQNARPKLSKEEWLEAHGLGAAAGTAD